MLAPGIGRASDLCADLEILIGHASTDFTTLPVGAAEAGGAVPPMLDGAADCAVARQLGGNIYFCTWPYGYRAEDAAAHYDRLAGDLQACLGDRATVRTDLGVNHPDTYDARKYVLDEATVTVSLKDKTRLGRTLVFLRVQAE